MNPIFERKFLIMMPDIEYIKKNCYWVDLIKECIKKNCCWEDIIDVDKLSQKQVYCFDYYDKLFDLTDHFILEIYSEESAYAILITYVSAETEMVNIPNFITLVREITYDNAFDSNSAEKKSITIGF